MSVKKTYSQVLSNIEFSFDNNDDKNLLKYLYMFKVFGDNFREHFLKFYFQSFLLIERTLRIRSQNQLTMREMLLLGLLERMKLNNSHTAMNVAKYLQVSAPVISSSIKSLIRKGYVKKVLNLEDNRIFYLEMTEKGINSNKRSLEFSEKLLAKGMKKLSAFDVLALRKAFHIVESIIDEEHRQLDLEEPKKSE
jgi:DNA-binding MarR family transcriptional regulator